jgi:hypothetical protein
MGIHNESGHRRVSPVPPLRDLIPQLLDLITSTTDKERSFLPFQGNKKDSVVLLVNNLGGLSELELGGIVAETRRALDARSINIQRVLAGSFMVNSSIVRPTGLHTDSVVDKSQYAWLLYNPPPLTFVFRIFGTLHPLYSLPVGRALRCSWLEVVIEIYSIHQSFDIFFQSRTRSSEAKQGIYPSYRLQAIYLCHPSGL